MEFNVQNILMNAAELALDNQYPNLSYSGRQHCLDEIEFFGIDPDLPLTEKHNGLISIIKSIQGFAHYDNPIRAQQIHQIYDPNFRNENINEIVRNTSSISALQTKLHEYILNSDECSNVEEYRIPTTKELELETKEHKALLAANDYFLE